MAIDVETMLTTTATYGAESTHGTQVEASTAIGLITGGGIRVDNQMRKRVGLSANTQIRPGLILAEGNFTFIAQNDTLAKKGIRTSYPAGPLDSITVEAGISDYTVDLVGGKINSITFRGAMEEALEVSMEVMALFAAEGSGDAHATHTETTLEDFEGLVTIATADHDCQSFEATVNNNCRRVGDLSSKTANQKRRYVEVVEGLEAPSGTFDVLKPDTANMVNDVITAVAAQMSYVDAAGGTAPNTWTLDWGATTLYPSVRSFQFQGGDDLWVQTLEYPEIAEQALTLA